MKGYLLPENELDMIAAVNTLTTLSFSFGLSCFTSAASTFSTPPLSPQAIVLRDFGVPFACYAGLVAWLLAGTSALRRRSMISRIKKETVLT
jgi:hypothetical protein